MFQFMKIYTVHIKPELPQAGEKPVFVREGFNVAAFLFTFLWAFYYRLWLPAFGILAVNLCLVMLGQKHALDPLSIGVIQLAIQFIAGFHANDWRRRKLARRGYLLADIVLGDSRLRAEQRYFERYLAAS